jgi:eukaryotic-like serine/threonine-protein kinase
MVPSRPVRALKALLRWGVAVAGAGAGCGLALWLTLWISVRTSAALVPSVVGREPAQAAALVQEAGLVARVQEGVFDPQIPTGRVAQQRPTPGFQLKRGGTVLLYPSLGRATQKVPDLIGLPETVAESELEGAGLHEGAVSEVDGQSDAVTVVAQQPPPGVLVSPTTSVALLVNRTPIRRRYVMPTLVNVREDVATRIVRSLGFRLATVQRVDYRGLAPGVVLRQEPEAGAPVLDAAVVAMWVSQ